MHCPMWSGFWAHHGMGFPFLIPIILCIVIFYFGRCCRRLFFMRNDTGARAAEIGCCWPSFCRPFFWRGDSCTRMTGSKMGEEIEK